MFAARSDPGLIAARVVQSQAKPATTRSWQGRTLADTAGVRAATEEDLSVAMASLLARQPRIVAALAARHLAAAGLGRCYPPSSYVEAGTVGVPSGATIATGAARSPFRATKA